MLQELVARTGAVAWAIGSMLFFLAVWVGVVVWVSRARQEDMDARARLPFEDDRQASGVTPRHAQGDPEHDRQGRSQESIAEHPDSESGPAGPPES